MCSIAGIISSDPRRVYPAAVERMNKCQAHRGPDGQGYYLDQQEGIFIGFAHNRLSVIDLSEQANQPLHYNNRYRIVYNGEIYNYIEIRDQLQQKGYVFRSQSDTEVIMAAYDAYGANCLDQFDGMFAFAIWDEVETRLFCARDRFGEKPFYFHFDKGSNTFYFSSELKGLFAAGVDRTPDPVMLYNYLTLGFTKRPDQPGNTFFRNIQQLPPSYFLVYDPREQLAAITRYWDLDKETKTIKNETEALADFSDLLKTSIARRLRSDVPIGTSLSGGLDSSSIAAMIMDEPGKLYSYQAFSAIFPGFEKDEYERIHATAKHFHLHLNTVTPTGNDLAEQLHKLVNIQDEPFGSSSVFAQALVYHDAQQKGVKVLMDGQGADEVLAGYTKYTHWYLQELASAKGWRNASHEAARFRLNGFLDHWGWKNWLASKLPSVTASLLEKKARRQQRVNSYIDSAFTEIATDPRSIYKPLVEKLNDIQYFDLTVMGLEELLRYADRNSMASGIEVRLPFLSHELVQFVFSLPSDLRMREGYTKWILRKTMDKKLPGELCWQKGKVGFEPPQKNWMQLGVIKNLLQSSRQKLVDQKICTGSLLSKPIVASDAHGPDNFDFRCLIAGMWIN